MKTGLARYIVAGAMAGVLSSPAQAALIGVEDYGNYVTDTQTGMDWYKVSSISGWSYSYAYVQSELGVGGEFEGWRYATASEFVQMTENFTGLTTSITGVEQNYNLWGSNPDSALIKELLGLFGPTYVGGGVGGSKYLRGYLADQNLGGDPYFGRITSSPGSYGSNSISTTFGNSTERVGGTVGSWLVRADVPEPSSLVLLAGGIFGIGLLRRKRLLPSS